MQGGGAREERERRGEYGRGEERDHEGLGEEEQGTSAFNDIWQLTERKQRLNISPSLGQGMDQASGSSDNLG